MTVSPTARLGLRRNAITSTGVAALASALSAAGAAAAAEDPPPSASAAAAGCDVSVRTVRANHRHGPEVAGEEEKEAWGFALDLSRNPLGDEGALALAATAREGRGQRRRWGGLGVLVLERVRLGDAAVVRAPELKLKIPLGVLYELVS